MSSGIDYINRSHDDELATQCNDREFKAKLGVTDGERLMLRIYWPEGDDCSTPQEEADLVAGRLRCPVVVTEEDCDTVLAFARPMKRQIQPKAKQAVAHEFTQNELALLIRGMREVEVIEGDEQLLQWGLLERFELELLHRFGTFVEDFDAEEGEKEAWADRELAKQAAGAAR